MSFKKLQNLLTTKVWCAIITPNKKGGSFLIDKLIRYRLIEIVVVITLVLSTIPIWQRFDTLISQANITTLDSYNLNFNIEHKNKDIITINNDYNINKNYIVYLMLDVQDSLKLISIIINNKEYNLDNFYYQKDKNKCIYTILNDYITASYEIYEITLKFSENNIKYDYVFEEKSIF